MRRISLRQGADWNMGRVGNNDMFHLRPDAPATPVSANDNNEITNRRDWAQKRVSKKKKKEPKSQIFVEADIGKIVAVSGSVARRGCLRVSVPRKMSRILSRWIMCPPTPTFNTLGLVACLTKLVVGMIVDRTASFTV